MRTAFSIFAVFGLIASLSTHLTTFFGINPADYVPWVWALHLGPFIAIIPLFKKDLWKEVWSPAPRWARFVLAAFAVYVPINLGLYLVLTEAGHAEVSDGVYVLVRGMRVIRELSESEYQWQQIYVVRGFSGHWMIFYFVPVVYSWYRQD